MSSVSIFSMLATRMRSEALDLTPQRRRFGTKLVDESIVSYGLALDAGLIQPQTLLGDAPRRFAGYNPENSDRQFLGPIGASEVLRRSRNIRPSNLRTDCLTADGSIVRRPSLPRCQRPCRPTALGTQRQRLRNPSHGRCRPRFLYPDQRAVGGGKSIRLSRHNSPT